MKKIQTGVLRLLTGLLLAGAAWGIPTGEAAATRTESAPPTQASTSGKAPAAGKASAKDTAAASSRTPTPNAKKPDTTTPAAKKSGDAVNRRVKKDEPVITVGLATAMTSAAIAANGAYVVRDAKTGETLASYAAKQPLAVTRDGRRLALNGKSIAATSLRVTPADERTAITLRFAGQPYRGLLRLDLTPEGITVVNEVKLDDYLGGVIDEEMAPGWPQEALRAQAVAARTFALYATGKHQAEGFDVCPNTHCQVYGGIASESRTGLAAVAATRGEVMLYEGKPIYAAFHASSGGRTAGSEETGGALPYLKSVLDDDSASPRHTWKLEFSLAEAQQKLKAAGFDLGPLKKAELSPLVDGRNSGADRYASGRVRTARFTGSRKTVEIAGTKLRQIFGLPSTLFELRRAANGKAAANPKGSLAFGGKSDETLVFYGHGAGHGLGLSQWGAYAMAAKKDYRAILRHYYTGITIQSLF